MGGGQRAAERMHAQRRGTGSCRWDVGACYHRVPRVLPVDKDVVAASVAAHHGVSRRKSPDALGLGGLRTVERGMEE